MASKCQKWRLTFMKFHGTLLAFKMPKSSTFIVNIDILNAKKQGITNGHFWHFECQNWCLSSMKWTTGDRGHIKEKHETIVNEPY